jgi:hypothetical protein
MSQHRVLVWACIFVCLAASAAALAQPLPVDLRDWYEFRHASALPGMLFGVTPQGQVGFGGAFQQNIPVAYTPTLGNFVVGGNTGSNNHNPQFGLSGTNVNGTLFAGAGALQSPHGLWVSWMATGNTWEGCWNAQWQVLGPTGPESFKPAVAVGVQDLFDERNGPLTEHHSARSFYAVMTGSLPQATWRPIYWTVGIGDGRFKNGIAGLNVPIDDHFKLIGEWDSFNVNAGVAWGLNGAQNEKSMDVIGYAGETDLQYPVLGLTLTWH